jgi:hypothetical protein
MKMCAASVNRRNGTRIPAWPDHVCLDVVTCLLGKCHFCTRGRCRWKIAGLRCNACYVGTTAILFVTEVLLLMSMLVDCRSQLGRDPTCIELSMLQKIRMLVFGESRVVGTSSNNVYLMQVISTHRDKPCSARHLLAALHGWINTFPAHQPVRTRSYALVESIWHHSWLDH